ncbi:MAG: VCBS repeat-containing protein [Myxococcales bacterium]|nr:VCBS repeat-containing protein [Myxococcales bacterium]
MFVYAGSATGLDTVPSATITTGLADENMGWWLSSRGDTDGDGYTDLLVASAGARGEGGAALYLGGVAGVGTTPVWTVRGTQDDELLGTTVDIGGDVNGDGFADLLLTAWASSNGQAEEGHAELYLGAADGPAGEPAWLVETNQVAANVGSAAFVGDLDGDGFVGITDLNIVLGNWNQNVTPGNPLEGDPNGDGFVGIEDLNEVLGNWNAGTPPAQTAVPEPATLLLFGAGVAAGLRRRM